MATVKTELEKRDLQRMSNAESNKITRECLQTALIYLMAEKPLDKISVTELVKRSGVSRTAFYRNYTTKESILDDLVKDIVDRVTKALRNDEIFSSPKRVYQNFFEEIKAHHKSVMLLYRSDLLNIIIGDIVKTYKEQLDSTDEKMKYIFAAISGAHIGVMTRWLENNMAESSEYMAEIAADIQKRLTAGLVINNAEQ
ncbi:MAG: TetR/AcrR family transcriptional regulator [Ruminococcus sp.]|nr:TetR/AcrR family transcriptional regulator [Ruminococcus sp.]